MILFDVDRAARYFACEQPLGAWFHRYSGSFAITIKLVTLLSVDIATVDLEMTESLTEGSVADVVVRLTTEGGGSLETDVTVTLSTALDTSGSNPGI